MALVWVLAEGITASTKKSNAVVCVIRGKKLESYGKPTLVEFKVPRGRTRKKPEPRVRVRLSPSGVYNGFVMISLGGTRILVSEKIVKGEKENGRKN